MVEIELVRKRGRAARRRRRRRELLLALVAVTAVLATVLVVVGAVSEDGSEPRRPAVAGGLADLPLVTPARTPGTQADPPPPPGRAAEAVVATSEQTAPAGRAVDDRATDGAVPTSEPYPGSTVQPDVVSPPAPAQDGPISSLVDPLVRSLGDAAPALEPVRRITHRVTACLDETLSNGDLAACLVTATVPR